MKHFLQNVVVVGLGIFTVVICMLWTANLTHSYEYFTPGNKFMQNPQGGLLREIKDTGSYLQNCTAPKLKHMRCHRNEFMHRLPNVLHIGVMKTGTDAVLYFLTRINDQIVRSIGEPNFFRNVILHNNQLHPNNLEEYRERMNPSCPGDLIIDKSPGYFQTKGVANAVYKWQPDIKLLLSLRDPIDRAVSHFHHTIRHNRSNNIGFEEIVIDKYGKVDEECGFIRYSLYDIHLKEWLQYFSLEHFHIIDTGLVISNPSIELMKVETFLGLQPKCTPDKFVFNEDKGFYCVKNCSCMSEGKGHKHPPIPDRVKIILRKYFIPHVMELKTLIGRELSWMGKYIRS